MPLSMVAPGQEVELVAVYGGWGIRRHLADMGFNPGVRIKVIQGGFSRGPIIVAVRDTRLALGRGMAHKIMVKPLEHKHGLCTPEKGEDSNGKRNNYSPGRKPKLRQEHRL